MRATAILALSLALSLFSAGCVHTNILEQTGLIIMVGYDDAGENKLRSTSLLYQVDPRAKEKTQVISSVATSSKGSREASNLGMAKKLASGQLRVAVYGEDLVRKRGIFELADTLSRDPNVGRMVFLAISKGEAQDLMAFRYPETSNLGTFLYQDIKQNTVTGNLPSATLHEFIRDYYEVGRDPVMPILEKTKNKVIVSSIALFRDDRIVGESDVRSGYFIKTFRDGQTPTSHEVLVPNREIATVFIDKPTNPVTSFMITTLKQKHKIKLIDPQNLRFQIQLQINAEVLEISEQVDLSKPENELLLADALGHQIRTELQALLQRCIDLQTDPIGLGEIYRATVRGTPFTRDQWHEMMKRIQLDTRVKVVLVRSGVVE